MIDIIPFPKFHFVMPGFARRLAVKTTEISKPIFHPETMVVACDIENSRYLSAAAMFRVDNMNVEQSMLNLWERKSRKYVEKRKVMFANNVKTDFLRISPKGLKASATVVVNSTAIKEMFERIINEVSQKKSFYKNRVDNSEFTQALTTCNGY
jgi:tubulin beta